MVGEVSGGSVQRRELVVAIDGPSGSGKSTVARGVARRLGLRYLDTGAMYRAVTWLALHRGIDLTRPADLADLAEHATLEIVADPAAPRITADGNDVSEAVRGAAVTAAVSAVSAVPGVRAAMVRRQRELIGEGGVVVEGRDIATTVAPDAAVKIYLTADTATRAKRRSRQDGLARTADAVASTAADLARRDRADSSRSASPLQQAPEAVVVDSSQLGVDEVVAAIVARAEAVSTA
jgi:CMP/dCMP kinase